VRSLLCELVEVEVPIIQAGMSIFTSPVLAAAVSDAGALGSLGAWNRPTDQLQRELDELRDLTEARAQPALVQAVAARCCDAPLPGVTCVSRSRQHAGYRSARWPWVVGIGPVWDGVGAPCVT